MRIAKHATRNIQRQRSKISVRQAPPMGLPPHEAMGLPPHEAMGLQPPHEPNPFLHQGGMHPGAPRAARQQGDLGCK